MVKANTLLLVGGLCTSNTLAFAPPTSIISSGRTTTKSSSSSILYASSEAQYDCLVIGGGISGSTLAHNLHKSNLNILLAEQRDYLGGNVKSVIHTDENGNEFIFEKGPNSFATQPSIVRISHELGIDDQLVFANESLPPWVNHNGKLHPLPKGQGGKGPKGQIELVFGPNGVLKFGLVGDLLSWPGKIRAGIGAFLGHMPPPENKEETIKDWVTRILGEEVFYRIIDPFVSGVYAGDPTTLSMKAALPKISRIEDYSYGIDWNKFGAIFYGGLARQVELTKERKADPPSPEWVEFEYGNPGSYKRGLSTLPNAINENLGSEVVKLEWALNKVEKKGDTYVVTFDTPNGQETVTSRAVVSTMPTHAMGSTLEPVLPGSTDLFTKERQIINRKGIYYPPVAAVTLAYPKSAFKDIELSNDFGNLQNLPGFGMLNPRSEGVRTLGTLWSSSLFPGRCPEDYNILLNYIGGSRDPEIGTMSEEDVIAAVDKDLRTTLLQSGAPEPKVLGIKVWPTAIPQYELGHLELMKQLEGMESNVEGGGIWVCGNYRSGVAFPDCVTFGYEHAKVVKDYLDKQQ
jgi:oxygen-dependent protoporphyrinogen oxidase